MTTIKNSTVTTDIIPRYVVVETMPDYLRESHRAAGNWGQYPVNGAERSVVTVGEAESLVESDQDGYARIVRDAKPSEWEAVTEDDRSQVSLDNSNTYVLVSELSDADAARAERGLASMAHEIDPRWCEQIHGTVDTPREWVAAFAAHHRKILGQWPIVP